MNVDLLWLNTAGLTKKQGKLLQCLKFFFFSAIAWMSSVFIPCIITGAEFYSDILFCSYIVTGIMVSASGLLTGINCDYVESSEEEQRALRERRINTEGLSFSERISMTCKRRNDQIPERDNTERGNSSEEGSKKVNYSFLRRINFIKRLNLIEKFSRKKNPEEHCILEGFQKHEKSTDSIKEKSLIGDSSFRVGYGTSK